MERAIRTTLIQHIAPVRATFHRDNFKLDRLQHPEEVMKRPAVGRLNEIGCPTMVLIGDSDTPELVHLADLMAKQILGARHVTIKNAAHLPSLEHPEEFNRLLMGFLEPISGML